MRILAMLAILAGFIGFACSSTVDQTTSASVSSSSSDASSSSGGGFGGMNSRSSSSGQGGSGGKMLMNGDPCYFNFYEGIYENDHCLLCGPGNHLFQILAGYPLDPDSCYQYVCLPDPGSPFYAFPSKNVKEANTPCIYLPDIQPINNATCTEDGQCCYTDQNLGDICSPVPEYP